MGSETILVVGGGIAGISAAVEAAETGYEVVLVEKSASLGGRVAQLNRYFPKLCHPACGLEINYQRIRNNPKIKVLTQTHPVTIGGSRGDYKVTVKTSPRYVSARCTACGDCAKAATARVENAFNYDMKKAKRLPRAKRALPPPRVAKRKRHLETPKRKRNSGLLAA